MVKKCNRCGKTKDITQFNLSHRAKDGLQYQCRTCQSIAYKYSNLKPRYNYLHTRPQWELDIVKDAVTVILQLSDKYGNLNAKQVGAILEEMRQRGVA